MNQNTISFTSQKSRVMTTEQFEEIVDAILCGKYSWACVLILRFANYNPLHYIPYRTYKRLVKDNQKQNNLNESPNSNLKEKRYTACKDSRELSTVPSR